MKPVFANWLLISKPDGLHYRVMRTNWLSRLVGSLAMIFTWDGVSGSRDHANRDEERVRRELELIRMRFQHRS